MKKLYILLLFPLILGANLSAQDYFPEGATWYYDVPPGSFPFQYTYTFMECKGDSIFNNDTLTFIEGTVSCSTGWDALIKQNGQKIYQLNLCDSSLNLLYDFGASVGDTLVIDPDPCDTWSIDSIILVVDSIKPININGNILNQFFITQINFPFWAFPGNIIEGIGNTYSFYPLYGTCDPWGGPLRCYNDTIIGEYKTGIHGGVCDTNYLVVGIEETRMNDVVKIFPNPTKDKIQVSSNSIIEEIQLFDIQGRFLFSAKKRTVDLSSLSKGVYIVKIHLKNEIVNKKIIRE